MLQKLAKLRINAAEIGFCTFRTMVTTFIYPGQRPGFIFLPLHGVSGLAFAWLVLVIALKNCRLFLRTGEEILRKGAR